MRIFIITEGGLNAGTGHITRCISLCQAFEENGLNPELIVNSDNSALDLLRSKNYRAFNWLRQNDKLFKIIRNAEIVIVDSYLADAPFYEDVSKLAGTAVYIDDNKRMDYPRGIVVNGSIYAEKIDYPKRNGVTYLLGTRYAPLRKEFWDAPQKRIGTQMRSILITFGGNDTRNITTKVLKFLNGKYPVLIKHVVVGKGFKNIKGIERLKDEKVQLIYDPDAGTIKKLMLECDVAISAGGQTLYELARVGLPTIAIAVSSNQLNNIKGWLETGFIRYVGWYENKGLLFKLKGSIDKLASPEERIKHSEIGRSLLDGNGTNRIVKAVTSKKITSEFESYDIELRKAKKCDCHELWSWRNHPEVRRWSFNPGEIKYSKHKEWFYKVIKDKRICMYIAENEVGEKVGQIRFDINDDGRKSANVSANLNPRYFGKGLGNKIIKKGTEFFMQEHPRIKEILADIIDENIVSKKAFQKAGYTFSHNAIKDGRRVAIFKLGAPDDRP